MGRRWEDGSEGKKIFVTMNRESKPARMRRAR